MSVPLNKVGIRLDIWLWRARFFKTRVLSAQSITRGQIRIVRDGQVFRIRKPHSQVYVGDQLTFMIGDSLYQIEVLLIGESRGSAVEARKLYGLVCPAISKPISD